MPDWLPADPGMTRNLSTAYPYSSAAIPYRDFPFGTCPRLGRGGTSSNRSDNQRAIRLFSAAGKYNAQGAHLSDPSTATGSSQGYDDDAGDLPYEPPRANPRSFDPGPPADLGRLLWGPSPASRGPTSQRSASDRTRRSASDQSTGAASASSASWSWPTRRRRTTSSPGTRSSGEAGQRFQGFLRAAGLSQRYLILRSIPVDTLDLTAAARNAIVDDAKVRALHGELLRRIAAANGGLAALVAVGTAARRLAPHVAPAGLPIVELAAHGGAGWAASWQAGLTDLAARNYAKDVTNPTFALPATRSQLPRIDLPYGTTRWIGTSGDRGIRPRDLDLAGPRPTT